MTNFNVPSMNCGHCSATIEEAIKSIDPTATVSCELPTRTVSVKSFLTDRAISVAIRDAGYEVVTSTPS